MAYVVTNGGWLEEGCEEVSFADLADPTPDEVDPINELLYYIATHNLEEYMAALKSFPLYDCDEAVADELLVILLNHIAALPLVEEVQDDETLMSTKNIYPCLHPTLEHWHTVCDRDMQLTAYLRLWVAENLRPETLECLVLNCPQHMPNNLFIDLLNSTNGAEFSLTIADAIVDYYQPAVDFWSMLANMLNLNSDGDADHANKFIVGYIRARNNLRPSWMREGLADFVLTELEQRKLEALVSPLQLVDSLPALPAVLTKGHKTKITAETYRLSACQQFAISTIIERVRMLPDKANGSGALMGNYTIADYAFDEQVFRSYGPINSQHEKAGADGCDRHLDCRMMTCQYYEEDLGEEELASGWFTGVCQMDDCQRLIPRMRYAVREPLMLGGWRGCYCSWACVSNYVNNRIQLDNNVTEAIKGDKLTVDEAKLIHELIVRIKDQLDRYGLYDSEPKKPLRAIHRIEDHYSAKPWVYVAPADAQQLAMPFVADPDDEVQRPTESDDEADDSSSDDDDSCSNGSYHSDDDDYDPQVPADLVF